MTDNEINIAIAECCGWKAYTKIGMDGVEYELFGQHGVGIVTSIPSYCTDLNAMHEAETQLTGGSTNIRSDIAAYMSHLWIVCRCEELEDIAPEEDLKFAFVHATARQRAEAWLRCKGLWKEAK